MGKKLKGGRRQILQLEEKKPPKSPKPKAKMKTFIHYSDSDDDSKKSNESESSATIQVTVDATPLDSEIADFFKEIDALTVPEELAEQSSSSPVEEESAKPDDSEVLSSVSQPDVMDPSQNEVDCTSEEQKEEAPCPWQEICDDSTGYSYYWNMNTNEVTWDCPEEYANYVQSLNSAATSKHKPADHSNEANVNKKAKRKKESVKLPEGAIIPISYFGNTSSDDDLSDSGSESPKLSKRPKIEKTVVTKKAKVPRKQDRKRNVDEDKSEIIGPQLPPDFQFPVPGNVEVEERVQMGPFLPSNYEGVSEETAHSEPNAVSIGAPLPTSVAASVKGAEVHSHKKAVEGIPDSTVNKAENVVVQTSNVAYGYRPVVDYDSFTDDEDEDLQKAVSLSKIETTETKYAASKIDEEDKDTNTKTPVSSFIEAIKNDNKDIKVINEPKARTNELKLQSVVSQPKDTKRRNVDIDSLFAAHSSYGKYGFGFGFREESDTENEVASQSRQERKSYRTEMKSVSFVKSDLVLNLGLLNEASISSEMESLEVVDEVIPVNDNSLCLEQTKEVFSEEPELVKEITSVDAPKMSSEEDAMVSSENVLLEEECDVAIVSGREDGAVDASKSNAASCVILEESSSDSTSFELTDDLDEIDKALCEALYKKKAKNSTSLPSSLSTPSSTEPQQNDLESSHEEPLLKRQTVEKNNLESEEDADFKTRIVDMASILIDKLTFLLSNSTSTLPSLNSLFIQLQTRFVDWQANALDSIYFQARLTEVNQYLHHYETGVVSGEWTCQWDRTNKRYFYLNHLTQVSQWTFPEELFSQEELPSNPSKINPSGVAEQDSLLVVTSSDLSCKGTSRSPSPPPPPPGVDSPPPPPPPSPPPATPPPPPDNTEREPEDMDLENSSDSNLAGLQQSPEHSFVHNTPAVFTSISSPSHVTIETKTLFPIIAVDEDATPCPMSVFNLEVSELIALSVPMELSEEKSATFAESSSVVVYPPEPSTTQHKAVTKPAPVKRKKTKIQPGLGLRKKNIPSLVEKWQKIKEEQEREDSNSNDSKLPNSF